MEKKKILVIIIALLATVLIGLGTYTFLMEIRSNEEPTVPEEPNTPEEPQYPVEPKYIDTVNNGFVLDELTSYKHEYITDYDTYKKFVEINELEMVLTNEDFSERSYLVLGVGFVGCSEEIKGVVSADVIDGKMKVVVGVEQSCGLCAPAEQVFLLPVDKADVNNNYTIEYDYYYINHAECAPYVSYKPIIYLYPEKEIKVNVKLGYPEKLITTYPKYQNSWTVLAQPNGDLIDLTTNRSLYGLYWEGENTVANGIQNEGFVVKGEDTIEFLEEKLALLGLTEREANEFIIYWLPILEVNEYNYIRFETMDEINNNMPLEISPKPDTVIRVLMEFKGLDKPIEVKEQKITTPVRKGFTVVEWGGTKLN